MASRDAVRLEEEIVRVEVAPLPPVRTKPAPQLKHTRAPRPPEARSAGEARSASRARRLLFGDGTYRPEPFPRPGRD